jgi:DNA topoisomerase IB
MAAFGEALPEIRRRVREDLALPDLPWEKVLATVVQLLDETAIRVGNEEYTRANGSFGLTTLRQRHVDVSRSTIYFHFRGKSGNERRCWNRCADRSGSILRTGRIHPPDGVPVCSTVIGEVRAGG